VKPNALNASIRCEQKRLQRSSETVPANNRILQALRQGISDRRASHTESPSAIKAESVARYDQGLSGDRSEMLPRCDTWLAQFHEVPDALNEQACLLAATFSVVNLIGHSNIVNLLFWVGLVFFLFLTFTTHKLCSSFWARNMWVCRGSVRPPKWSDFLQIKTKMFHRLSHWISHKYLLLTLSLIESYWNCLIQIISKLLSVVSRSSVLVYQVSLWLIATKFLGKIRHCGNLLVKRLLCI